MSDWLVGRFSTSFLGAFRKENPRHDFATRGREEEKMHLSLSLRQFAKSGEAGGKCQKAKVGFNNFLVHFFLSLIENSKIKKIPGVLESSLRLTICKAGDPFFFFQKGKEEEENHSSPFLRRHQKGDERFFPWVVGSPKRQIFLGVINHISAPLGSVLKAKLFLLFQLGGKPNSSCCCSRRKHNRKAFSYEKLSTFAPLFFCRREKRR